MQSNVSLGDASKLHVKGKRKIKNFQEDGNPQYISYISYVSNMKSNILSLGQLFDKEYIIHMEDNLLSLKDTKGRLIAKVQMAMNHMFSLHLKTELQKCSYGLIVGSGIYTLGI